MTTPFEERFQLRSFTHESLSEAARGWEAIAGEDEFEVELSALFDWCATHLTHVDGDAHALELFDTERQETAAILEMVNGKRGAMTKLLKFWPSPEFWKAEGDAELRSRLGWVYAGAFYNVLASGMSGDEVRIYGRNNTMYTILSELQKMWVGDQTGWDASMQGRWLALNKRK